MEEGTSFHGGCGGLGGGVGSVLGGLPADGVFAHLLDELDPLQDVGDVVEAPLLDRQMLRRVVQVYRPVRGELK